MQNLIEKLGWGEKGASMALWIGLSAVLLLFVVALAVWLIRMLRPSLNMSGGGGRGGRPQRLAVTDAFSLDREGRRLVIIRRDNVEHLLLIGGPNDVVVESHITRNEKSIRDRSGRSAETDAVQIAESALIGEPTPRTEPPAVAAPVQMPQAQMHPAAPPRVTPPPVTPPAAKPILPAKPIAAPAMPAPPAMPSPAVAPPAATNISTPPTTKKLDEDFERALAAMQAAQRQKLEQPAAPPPPPPMPVPLPVADPVPAAPQAPPAPERPAKTEPMSEMARRLNEVLQKPLSGQLRPPFNRPIPPVPPMTAAIPKTEPQPEPVPPPMPELQELPELPELPKVNQSAPPPPAAPVKSAEAEMDMLEEEMARLLGRPAQPTKPGKP